jgi:MFS family permease
MVAAGVNVLVEIIVCDLVPLRERGNYLALIFSLIAIGAALGPLFGGVILQHSTWRWVFYLNLPVGGVALILLVLFLHVEHKNNQTLATNLGRKCNLCRVHCFDPDSLVVGRYHLPMVLLLHHRPARNWHARVGRLRFSKVPRTPRRRRCRYISSRTEHRSLLSSSPSSMAWSP